MICQLSFHVKCFMFVCLTRVIVVKPEHVIINCRSTGFDDNLTQPCACSDGKVATSELSTFSEFLPTLKLHLGNVSRLILNALVPSEKIHKNFTIMQYCIDLLDVSGNNITTIKNDSFKKMKHLNTLILSNNNISSLPVNVFSENDKLSKLDLSYNFFTIVPTYVFKNSLDFIDFSHNKISFNHEPPCKLKKNISEDNSTNFIKWALVAAMSNVTINLTSNSISGLLLARLECDKTLLHGSLRIILKDNPIQCDCKAYSLIEYFQNESNNLQNYVKPCVNIDNDISCITRDKKSVPLSLVNISNMPCDVSDCHECPNNCNCESYIKIETVNMRCENAGLTSVPSLLARSPYEVKMLSLQRNRIKDIDALKDYNLQGLQILELDNNELKVLRDPSYIEALNLTRITLGNNPWNCSDCQNKNFVDFLNRVNNVKDIDEVKCSDSSQLVKLSKILSCSNEPPNSIEAIVTTSILIAILCITILIGIYVRYKFKRIKRLMPVARDIEMPEMLTYYDIFISYSHEDELYVAELVRRLEDRPNPYKICLHSRNWKPGEFIVKQMAQSIKLSRTTVVVLSASYAKSEWCNAEFHLALTEMVLYRNHKVIVIWYERKDPKYFNLEPILENYLHMCTYLKRDDRHFMNKLEAAIEND